MTYFSQWLRTQSLKGNNLFYLLSINIGLFLIVKVFLLVLMLFRVDGQVLIDYLQMPSNVRVLLLQPWSVITYMFLHVDFFHLFFNMLCLYWFGNLFLNFFSQKQLVGVYLLSGIFGGLVFLGAYNLFPLFVSRQQVSYLLGASAAVMGLMVAVAVQSPNYPVRLFLIGEVKLKYVALVMVLVSFFGITSNNAGGEFSHLGGALFGFLFTIMLRRGQDWSRPVSCVINWCHNVLKFGKRGYRSSSPFKVKRNPVKQSDAEYNQQKAANNKEVDIILDKIKRSGYSSLTSEEKKRLFDKSRKL